MMILLFLAIGFAIYYFTTEDKNRYRRTTGKLPIEMLKQRFVSGEIDEETYKRTMKVLTQ